MKRAISSSALALVLFTCVALAAGPALAGDRMPALIRHNQNLTNTLKRNVAKCNKAIAAVKAYHKKNIKEFKRMKKETQAYIEAMTPQQQKAYGKRYAQQIMKVYGDMLQVSAQFEKKCPKRGAKISYVFQDFSLGSK